MAQYLHRLTPEANGAVPLNVSSDTTFADHYPALLEYLSENRWEDGTARECATLTVFFEDGLFKCCLNDRANSRVAWCSSLLWDDLLEQLDHGIQEGKLAWRLSKFPARKKG